MIPCVEVRRHLMDFHYNLLPEWESEEIRLHLEGCAGCRSENVRVRRGIARFDGWKVPAPPATLRADFARRLQAELDVSPRKPSLRARLAGLVRRPPSLRLRPALTAAMAVFLLWGAGKVYNATRPVLNLETYARDYQLLLQDPSMIEFTLAKPRIAAVWMENNKDFTSRAPALNMDRFRFQGVRLSRLQDQPVAVWVYRRKSETVLLFERPDDGSKLPAAAGEVSVHTHRFAQVWSDGLNLLSWKANGRVFTAASAMDSESLAWLLCHGLDAGDTVFSPYRETATFAAAGPDPITFIHHVRKRQTTD